MFLSYIHIAWRSLQKNRAVSIINIGGLTMGLASAVLAILFAQHELSYENSHEKADRISRVYIKGNFDQVQWMPTSFGPDGPALKTMFPEVEEYTRSYSFPQSVARVGEHNFFENNIYASDSNFFNILTFPFTMGGPSSDINTVVVSESTALRYFGKSNPLGETIRMTLRGHMADFDVTGVYKDLPSNTHLKVDFIIPWGFLSNYSWLRTEEYAEVNYMTFLLLNEGVDYKELNQKMEASYQTPVDIEGIGAFLIPLKEIHMRGTWGFNKGKLMAFLIGGLFVLIITSLNYINLTNILFSTRNKEIGIRKVNGARRKHIFFQFLTDTMLTTLLAFIFALVIIQLVLPWFNSLMVTSISISANAHSLLLLLFLFVGTIILSGIYPALRYSGLKPVTLMKPLANTLGGKGWSRRILTTFQFFLSIIFIQFMLAINAQNNFMYSNDYMRYNSENVICISGKAWGDLNRVKEELLRSPLIEEVSWGSSIPEMFSNMTNSWKEEGNQTMAVINFLEEDYLKVFDIKMLQGRFFSHDFPMDMEQSLVINQLVADIMGYDDPIGNRVMLGGEHFTIIGVIDTYRTVPPIFDHMPMLVRPGSTSSDFLTIRVCPANREEAHNYITKTLHSFNPDYPVDLQYHFDVLEGTEEAKPYISAVKLMKLFFMLTITTSLVGLFGLSLFIAQRNRRVVGIHKVMGASITNIMLKLSKGLVIQVLIAIVLATPVAMVIITGYLSVFPSDFSLGLPFYLMGGGGALLLVLLTVSWQTWKAAMANPTEVLRSE